MKALDYLTGNYFHQDWEINASTPIGVVHAFSHDELTKYSTALRDEIMELLSDGAKEADLGVAWRAGEPSWDPVDERWGTYRMWFEAMLDALTT